MNIANLLFENREKFGNYDRLIFKEKIWTLDNLIDFSSRIGAGLNSLGILPGDRVAIMLPPCPEAYISFQAIWQIGATAVPIHTSSIVSEIEKINELTSAKAIILSNPSKELLSRLSQFPKCKLIVVGSGTEGGTSNFEALALKSSLKTSQVVPRAGSDPAVIVFTSGSTGVPKGIIHSHFNFERFYSDIRSTPGLETHFWEHFHNVHCTELHYLSNAHVGGAMRIVGSYYFKSKAVILEGFDPIKIMNAIELYKVDVFAGPPAVFSALCASPDFKRFNLSSVKCWRTLSAPFPSESLERCERILGSQIYQKYGMTETMGCVVAERTEPRRKGTIGRSISGVNLKVIDEVGADLLEPNSRGELCAQLNKNFAIDYVNAPSESKLIIRDGWLQTGDMAEIDSEGFVTIFGRKSQMINQGGFKIMPSEIESAIRRIAAVEDCAVIGVPDDLFGSVVGAFLVVRRGLKLDDLELIEHCRKFLSENKIPRKIYFLDALPRGKTSKVDFPKLLRFAAEHGSNLPKEGDHLGMDLQKLFDTVRAVLSNVLKVPLTKIGADIRLSELGLTSLKAVEFSSALGKKIGLNLPSSLAFNKPTVSQIADFLKGAVGSSAESLKFELIRPKDLIGEARLSKDIVWTPSAAVNDNSDSIFLTGATGFLGAHVLAKLAESSPKNLICLVRAKTEGEARQRVLDNLSQLGLLENRLTEKLNFVCGDLGEERFGLSGEIFEGLANRVSAIFHLAARVNHLYSFTDLRKENVQGTHEVLRFSSIGIPKQVVYCSTIAIGARTEAENLDHDRPIRTGYAQSKWVAEKLIAVGRERGLNGLVFRPGQLSWNGTTGAGSATQFECLILRAIAVIRRSPPVWALKALLPNLTPVDYAAEALVRLSIEKDPARKNYHLINPLPANWARILEKMGQFGYQSFEIPYEQWLDELRRLADKDESAALLFGLLTGREIRVNDEFPYSNEETVRSLSKFNLPELDPSESVKKTLDFFVRKGIFPKPQ